MCAVLRVACVLAVVGVSEPAWANRCTDAMEAATAAVQRSNARLQLILQKRDHAVERAQAIADGWNADFATLEAEAKEGGDLEPIRARFVHVLDGVARERGNLIRDILIITVELNSAWEDRAAMFMPLLKACRR